MLCKMSGQFELPSTLAETRFQFQRQRNVSLASYYSLVLNIPYRKFLIIAFDQSNNKIKHQVNSLTLCSAKHLVNRLEWEQ